VSAGLSTTLNFANDQKREKRIFVIELLKIINTYFFSVYCLYLPIKLLNSLTKMGQSSCATAVQAASKTALHVCNKRSSK
jgi:hypothetical protein